MKGKGKGKGGPPQVKQATPEQQARIKAIQAERMAQNAIHRSNAAGKTLESQLSSFDSSTLEKPAWTKHIPKNGAGPIDYCWDQVWRLTIIALAALCLTTRVLSARDTGGLLSAGDMCRSTRLSN